MESRSICRFMTDISLNVVSLSFIHVVAYDRISFFFKAE